jgi:hypothetical protein
MSTEWKYFSEPDVRSLEQWMREWRASHPRAGVLTLLAEQDKGSVKELQRLAIETDLPLVGAMFPELIAEGVFHKQGLLLCGLDPMPSYRLLGNLDTERHRKGAVESLRDMVLSSPEEGTLTLVFDGMYGQIASFLDALFYALGGSCWYAGVNAGSETFQPMPCLFDAHQWIGNGVLALMLPGVAGAELEHGYVIPDQALPATAANGNRIILIDWQPAFHKYAELIKTHYNEQVTRENFYSMGVHFPFALVRADGEVLIRIPVAVDDEGALFCVGEVPDGALLSVARAVLPGSTHTVKKLLEKYRARRAQHSLLFYCAGRRMHFPESARQELSLFTQGMGSQPVIGGLSLGEIANSPSGGYPLFHNATLMIMPLST